MIIADSYSDLEEILFVADVLKATAVSFSVHLCLFIVNFLSAFLQLIDC
jgi:hypothetical protein